jgi:hypothetical protein
MAKLDYQGGLLGGFADPQNMGLLSAAAAILDRSGPSTRPSSLGQILGGGLLAGVQGMQNAQDSAFQRRVNNMRLGEMERQIGETEAIRQAGRDAMRTPEQMALSNGQGPTQANADRIPGMQPSFDTQGFVSSLMGIDPLKGLELQRTLAKQQEEFGTSPQVGVDPTTGQPFTYLVGKNGTIKRLDNNLPRDKLDFQNLNGQTVGVNPYTGQTGVTLQHTRSPDSIASNSLGWANYNLSKQNAERAQQNADRVQHVTVDGQPFTFNPRTGQYAPGVGPGGAPLPRTDKPLTEAQSKDNLFGTRMQEADKTLSTLEDQGVLRSGNIKSFAEGAGRVLGLGTESLGGTLSDVFGTATNWTQSANQQKVEQAKRNFLNAALRKESGAVISPAEFANGDKQYFPQPGDSDAVIEQKRRNRQTAIHGTLAGVPGGSRIAPPPAANNLPNGWTVTEKP